MNKEVSLLVKSDIDSYIDFIKSTFDYMPEKKQIEKLIKHSKVFVIKKNDRIVCSATVNENFEYIKNLKFFHISYLGVLKEYRRLGYASKLFEEIEMLAIKSNIKYIELTSGNQRRAAHYFYKNKGFKLKDTTVFIKIY